MIATAMIGNAKYVVITKPIKNTPATSFDHIILSNIAKPIAGTIFAPIPRPSSSTVGAFSSIHLAPCSPK
ncbi:hypothetical protein MTCD1_03711 [Colwellia marinimaniae]|uniref:Uncharacterized protein n=1 Tax=Colwellia marinimaniae TaxID=1513592 RepID=A0ABQ0N091_9GAMM|nr:hypothetical protein MTCD1_03711 [Colwellia marinimaniae]